MASSKSKARKKSRDGQMRVEIMKLFSSSRIEDQSAALIATSLLGRDEALRLLGKLLTNVRSPSRARIYLIDAAEKLKESAEFDREKFLQYLDEAFLSMPQNLRSLKLGRAAAEAEDRLAKRLGNEGPGYGGSAEQLLDYPLVRDYSTWK